MKQNISDTIKDNVFLFAIVTAGIVVLVIGYAPPYHDMLVALGAAFIIAGTVGIYMMLATRQVAKKLHERFNVQNEILHNLDEKSEKQNEILQNIASSQKDMASSQKQNHSEMIDVLKKIEQKL